MKDLISVIVPIYQVEDYLIECLDSIINQEYTNLEIILVDDGSKDKCPEICDDYELKDNRIKVIHKPNGGLSDARNAGLEIAKGKYICFVDSDDVLNKSFVSILYDNIKDTGADISICDFLSMKSMSEISDNNITNNFKLYTKEEILNEFYKKQSLRLVLAWNKLYKRKIWKNIRYPKGKVHEDEFVIHHILDNINKLVISDSKLYYYRQRENSITSVYNKKRLNALEALEDRLEFYKKQTNEKMYNNTLYNFFFSIRHHLKQMKGIEEFKDIENSLKKKYDQTYRDLLKCKTIPLLKKIKLILFFINK